MSTEDHESVLGDLLELARVAAYAEPGNLLPDSPSVAAYIAKPGGSANKKVGGL